MSHAPQVTESFIGPTLRHGHDTSGGVLLQFGHTFSCAFVVTAAAAARPLYKLHEMSPRHHRGSMLGEVLICIKQRELPIVPTIIGEGTFQIALLVLKASCLTVWSVLAPV
jgi:hypothetical protein